MSNGPHNPEVTQCGSSRLTIAVAVLLLAFAVFGWGLHSKLSLYNLQAMASHKQPIAKLLSERERPAVTAQRAQLHGSAPHLALLVAGAVLLLPAAAPRPLFRPGATSPPSAHRQTFVGPSLRRPPPSTFA